MMTFLPYADFQKSAIVLDRQRLGKQRVEAKTIRSALNNPHNGWRHHPVVAMWLPYPLALEAYFNAISREWICRGYEHNIGLYPDRPFESPAWLRDDRVCATHRAALLAKNYSYYTQFGWKETPKIAYLWGK